MEVIVRDVTIRGEVEYVIDTTRCGLPMSKQLSLLMQASYNTLLTDPKMIQSNPEWTDEIMDLRLAVEKFLKSTSKLQN